MPDWRPYVRERLRPSKRAAGPAEDIVAELTAHLEEHYSRVRSQGMTEAQAIDETKTRAGNWQELRREILAIQQEDSMNDRVRQLWIPALVTLTLANVALALLLRTLGNYSIVRAYVPWLLMLPLIGAAGSFLARRGAGQGWRVYLAAMFPAVVLGGLFLLVLGFVSIFDRSAARHIHPSGFLLGVAAWVVLPAIALLTGMALQGLLQRSTRVSHA